MSRKNGITYVHVSQHHHTFRINLFFRLRVFFIFPIVCPLLHPRRVGKFTAFQQELRKCQPLECWQGEGDSKWQWPGCREVGFQRLRRNSQLQEGHEDGGAPEGIGVWGFWSALAGGKLLRHAGFYDKLLLGGGCKVAQALEWHLRPSSVPCPDIYTMAMPSCSQRLQKGPFPLQCPSQVLETLLTLQEKCSKGFHHLLWSSCWCLYFELSQWFDNRQGRTRCESTSGLAPWPCTDPGLLTARLAFLRGQHKARIGQNVSKTGTYLKVWGQNMRIYEREYAGLNAS